MSANIIRKDELFGVYQFIVHFYTPYKSST